MIIEIRKEDDRQKEAVDYIKRQIEDLEFQINSLCYYELPDGTLQYDAFAYQDERRQIALTKHRFEVLLDIMTTNIPRCIVE